MWDGTTTHNNIMFFSLCINLSSEYSIWCTYVSYQLNTYRALRAVPSAPPTTTWQWRSPPLVRNHAKTWWGLRRHRQKIYRRIARVSARWFDATAEWKAHVFTKKYTFCRGARRSAAYRIIVNKIKKQLVLRKKIASPCCGDRDRSRDIRRSHSPVNLEPLEAGGRGRSWCRCFFKTERCCGCCVLSEKCVST